MLLVSVKDVQYLVVIQDKIKCNFNLGEQEKRISHLILHIEWMSSIRRYRIMSRDFLNHINWHSSSRTQIVPEDAPHHWVSALHVDTVENQSMHNRQTNIFWNYEYYLINWKTYKKNCLESYNLRTTVWPYTKLQAIFIKT